MKALQKKRSVVSVLLILFMALAIGFAACNDGSGNDDGVTAPTNGTEPGTTPTSPPQVIRGPYVDRIEVLQHPSVPSGVGGMVNLTDARFKLTWVNDDGSAASPNITYASLEEGGLDQFTSERLTRPSNLGLYVDGSVTSGPNVAVRFSDDVVRNLTPISDRYVRVTHQRVKPGKEVYASVLVPAILPLRSFSVTGQIDEYYEDEFAIDPGAAIEVWGEYYTEAYDFNQEGREYLDDFGISRTIPAERAYRRAGFPAAQVRLKMMLPAGGAVDIVPNSETSSLEVRGVVLKDLRGTNGELLIPDDLNLNGTLKPLNSDPVANLYPRNYVHRIDVKRFYRVIGAVIENPDWAAFGWNNFTEGDSGRAIAAWQADLDRVEPNLVVTYRRTDGYGNVTNPPSKTRGWEYFQAAERLWRVNVGINNIVKETAYPSSNPSFSSARTGTANLNFSYWGQTVSTALPVGVLSGITIQGSGDIQLPTSFEAADLTETGMESETKRAIADAFEAAGYKVVGNFTASGGLTMTRDFPRLVNVDLAGNVYDWWPTGRGVSNPFGVKYAVQFYEDEGFSAKEVIAFNTGSALVDFTSIAETTVQTTAVPESGTRFRMVIVVESDRRPAQAISNKASLAGLRVRVRGNATPWVNVTGISNSLDKGETLWVTSDMANNNAHSLWNLNNYFTVQPSNASRRNIAFNVVTAVQNNRIPPRGTYVPSGTTLNDAVIRWDAFDPLTTRGQLTVTNNQLYITGSVANANEGAGTNLIDGTGLLPYNMPNVALITLKVPVLDIRIGDAGFGQRAQQSTAGDMRIVFTSGSSTTAIIPYSNIHVYGGEGTGQNSASGIDWIVTGPVGTRLTTNMIRRTTGGDLLIELTESAERIFTGITAVSRSDITVQLDARIANSVRSTDNGGTYRKSMTFTVGTEN